MSNPLVITLAIIICGLSFFKPIVGVFIIIITSWLGAIFPAEGVFTLNRILGIICLAGVFASQLIKPDKSPVRKFFTLEVLFIIYFAILFLSSFYSFSNPRDQGLLLDMMTGFIFYYLIKVTVVSKTHLENLVKTLVVISLVVAAYSIYAAQNADPLTKRISGEFQVNLAGIICYVGVVCTLWLSWAKKLPVLAAGIISMILISVIFLSGNRSGFVALLFSAMLFALRIFLTRGKRAWMIGTLILFTMVFIASFNLMQNYFPLAVERVFSVLPTSDSAITDLRRIDLAKIAWLLFLNHPILGIGFGNFPLYYASYSQEFAGHQTVAHNLFMSTLAEAGLMGIISLISIYLYIIYAGLKALFFKKDDPGIFDPWFPLILFVGLNIINALFHSTVIDRPMFTIFAINMIVLRNQQTKPMAADELDKQTSLLPKYKGVGSGVL